MKSIVLALALCFVTVSAQASKKALTVFKTLESIGLQGEPGLGTIYLPEVKDLDCQQNLRNKSAECTLVVEGEDNPRHVVGPQAIVLSSNLSAIASSKQCETNKCFISVQSLKCTAPTDPEPGTLEKRTRCSATITVDLEDSKK